MKFVLCNIFVICFVLPSIQPDFQENSIFSSFFPQSSTNVRKPRFRFFNEFIEPLSGVFNDLFPSTSSSDPVVHTENGFIRGVIKKSRDQKKYFAFLGIPYAVAPIGNLRFEPPQKLVGRWPGVRSASTYSKPCFHLDVFFSGRLKGNEDCLYANVYTKSLEANLLPVMVYIHGGGFCSGSGDFYQGKYFMDEDVVLVVFNYRLSALGFLNTEDGIIRGNMGLKDQNMLLIWVKDNIAQFGGDPSKVTLFGESAGAAMTQYHMLSHQSQGLFYKAISLSGSALSPWAFNGNPAASARRLAQTSGCPTLNSRDMVECLKTVPVQAFKEEYQQMMKTVANPAEYFAPSVETVWKDDTFLAMNPRDLLRAGNYSKIPLMMGVSSMEGLLYTSRIMVDPYAWTNMDKAFARWIPRFLYYDPDNSIMTSALKSYYFNNHSIQLQTNDFLCLTQLFSDGCFLHPSRQFAIVHAAGSAPVYLYYNTYQGRFSVFDILRHVPLPNFDENNRIPKNIPEISVGTELFSDLLRYRLTNEKPSNFGTSHGDTVFLLFNMRNVPGIGRLSIDYQMSKSFIKSLVDFANYHDNLTYNGKPWPSVSKSNQEDLLYMEIALPGRVVSEPFVDRMKFWDKLTKFQFHPQVL